MRTTVTPVTSPVGILRGSGAFAYLQLAWLPSETTLRHVLSLMYNMGSVGSNFSLGWNYLQKIFLDRHRRRSYPRPYGLETVINEGSRVFMSSSYEYFELVYSLMNISSNTRRCLRENILLQRIFYGCRVMFGNTINLKTTGNCHLTCKHIDELNDKVCTISSKGIFCKF